MVGGNAPETLGDWKKGVPLFPKTTEEMRVKTKRVDFTGNVVVILGGAHREGWMCVCGRCGGRKGSGLGFLLRKKALRHWH